MNPKEFHDMLENAAKQMFDQYSNDDYDKHPYQTGCDYGKYEMCRNILGHFNDMLSEYNIVKKEK